MKVLWPSRSRPVPKALLVTEHERPSAQVQYNVSKHHKTSLYWFRRAVRLDDNYGLTAVVAHSENVIPVFVLDPAILTQGTTGPARTRFLFDALRDVDQSLRKIGGRLIVRYGKPEEELARLVQETGATGLYFGREVEPYGQERDKRVTHKMKDLGVTVETFADHLLTEPGDVMTKVGTPYSVFTPYKRVWLEQPIDKPVAAPKHLKTPEDLHSEALPELPKLVGVAGELDQEPLVQGSEAEGRKWLDKFLDRCLRDYDAERDFPSHEGTSRLSAYLRSGVLSVRRVFADVQKVRAATPTGKRTGADTFLSELAWRDFYYQILFHYPHVAGHAFKPAYDGLQWENRDEFFDAWCQGKTGYPFIDAAQRQMNRQAWMHNRARMATASFLCKDLLCDWKRGQDYFMQKLIDGDLAPNNGGWQWAAGTGTDAQPFFRIFNPVSQGEKFDPDGTYVKTWCPELSKVPAKYIHSPWKLSVAEQEYAGCVLGRDYPHPIVDHKTQREKALNLYRGQEENAGAEPKK